MRKAEDIKSISPDAAKVTEFLMQNANKANEVIATGLVNLVQIINIGVNDINSLHSFLTYGKVYIQYVEEGLVTVDKLLQLINTPDGRTSFEVLGKYPDAVYKLCKYGMTFDKLITSGLENVDSLILLLRNVDAVIYFTKNNNLYFLKYLYKLGRDNGKTQSILLKNLNSIILLAENKKALSAEKNKRFRVNES